jgi:hypothetical protein
VHDVWSGVDILENVILSRTHPPSILIPTISNPIRRYSDMAGLLSGRTVSMARLCCVRRAWDISEYPVPNRLQGSATPKRNTSRIPSCHSDRRYPTGPFQDLAMKHGPLSNPPRMVEEDNQLSGNNSISSSAIVSASAGSASEISKSMEVLP